MFFVLKKPQPHIVYIHILTFLCNIIGSIANNYLSQLKKTLLGCMVCWINWHFITKGHFSMTDLVTNLVEDLFKHQHLKQSSRSTVHQQLCKKPFSHFLSYTLWRRHLTLTILQLVGQNTPSAGLKHQAALVWPRATKGQVYSPSLLSRSYFKWFNTVTQ